MARIYVALDLELTGLDPERDEIIEVGLVRFRGDEVQDTFSSLVGAKRRVPLKIQQLIGVSQEEVDGAPAFGTLRGTILTFIKSYPLIGHNIGNDLQFLRRQGLPLQNLAFDTFELASILVPGAQRYTLRSLAERLGIPVSTSHRALADALTSKELFLRLMARAVEWDGATLKELTQLAENAQWPLLHVFRDVLADRLTSAADGAPASKRSPRRAARPRAEELPPPLQPRDPVLPLDVDELAALISPGGLFAQGFPGYEHRPQQVEMLRAVAEAFNTPAHLLVEAGTGTGKTLAYLLPAVHYAAQNGRRVVISSNTINLQDQLFTKDIPDLQRLLPLEVHVALLKGRTNYLCLRSLDVMRRARQLSVEEARVLAKVLAWLPTTTTGDRAELLLLNAEERIWAQLSASSETCLGDMCPHRQSGTCFLYRAKARADRSHLVIVNHALLLSDLALDNRLLPDYTHLIIDEAHHLEDQATNQFGFRVGRDDLVAFLNGLGHVRRDVPGGLLAAVPGLFQREGVSATARAAVSALIEELHEQIATAEPRLYELFNMFERFLQSAGLLGKGDGQGYDQQVRLTAGVRVQPDWSNIEIAWEGLAAPLKRLADGLERLLAQIGRLELDEDL
ncbi:MAG: exonuclease domain-containing protein, partial [Chloroflexota bacterium]